MKNTRKHKVIRHQSKKLGKHKSNPISFYLGNCLIFLSVTIFFILFAPIISIYLFPPVLQSVPAHGFFITIPTIHAQAPVIENVDPWNDTIYHSALEKGVAAAKGFSIPGQNGLIYLFAHSSGMPWDQTYYNTIFLRLGDLKKNDAIILTRNGKKYLYHVREKRVVWPTDISFLLQIQKNELVLQTCTPIGTSLERLLVFSDPG